MAVQQDVANVFNNYRARLAKVIADSMPLIGKEIENYSLDAFNKEGWDGVPWQKRKNNKDPGRNLLVRAGSALNIASVWLALLKPQLR